MLETVSTNHYRLLGHIDMQESSGLLRELMELPEASKIGKQDLLLDVSALESSDSRGARLRVKGLSESMKGLARVYGIETLLENILETT